MEVPANNSHVKRLLKSRRVAMGSSLKSLRLEQGMSQHEFASRARVDQSVISRIESGKRSLKLIEVDLYAHALGMRVGPFLYELLEDMEELD